MGVPLDSDCYRQTVTFRAIVLNSFMTLAPMFMGRTGCWRSPGMSNDVRRILFDPEESQYGALAS